MSGYIRQDVTNNIADGNVINASDFDNEYNAIEAAFHASTGHTHDGTAAEGAPITKIGPTQDVVASASALTPKTDNTVDLGSSTLEYKDLWIDGTANIDSLVADTADINAGTIDGVTIGGAVRGAGSFTTLNANGNTTLGDAVGDTVTINGTATFVNANPTLSAGTANGVLYLDGSKVATSGSALTFDGTNLATTGGVRLDNAQYYYGKNAAGSAVRLLGVNAGNVNYVGAIDSGPTEVNYGAATTITTQYWNVGGSEQMRLTSTGLGIGTSSPGAKLDVAGSTYVRGDSSNATFTSPGQVAIKRSTNNPLLSFHQDDGTRFGYLLMQSAGTSALWLEVNQDLRFGLNNTEQMRLTSTGLGIGTSSPTQKLDVDGAIAVSGTKFFSKISGDSYIWNNTAALNFVDSTGNTVQMALDSSGNLGLGVTPSAWTSYKALQISTGASLASTANQMVLGSNWSFDGSDRYVISDFSTLYIQNSGQHKWFTAPSGTAGNTISFTQAMTLDSSGNLGIGTSSPGSKLDVTVSGSAQQLRLVSTGNAVFRTRWIDATTGMALESNNSTETAYYPLTLTGSILRIGTGDGSLKATLDASGNLGLGVTPSAWGSPVKALQIGDSSLAGTTTQMLLSQNYYYTGSGDAYLGNGYATQYYQVSGQHQWRISSNNTSGAGAPLSFTQAMTLDASGNLGVGETSPALTLHVKSAAAAIGYFETSDTGTGPYVIWRNGTTSIGDVGSGKGISGSGNATDFMIASRSTYPLLLGTGSTERARITSGGDFGIGNNNPQYRLTVDKDTTSALAFFTNSNASAPNGLYVDFSAASPNNATQYFLYCEDSTAQRATIRSNGGLANYQSNNVDLSDSRTKKDIAPAASMWSKIGALEIVTYKYNDQTHDDVNVGVIAQQVEQVEPVWVDSDGFGETPEDGVPLKTVYTKDITFAAIKALQEAMTRIEQLEARVAALEAA